MRGSYVYLGVDGGASTWTHVPSAYSQLSVSFTTGASQTSAKIYVHGWYAQGTYYADDISLDGPGGGGGSDTQAPTAPTGLNSTGKTSSSVSLSWGASSDNVGVTALRHLQRLEQGPERLRHERHRQRALAEHRLHLHGQGA